MKDLGFIRKDDYQYYDEQNKFSDALAKTAKKYGYKWMMFAENDNQERLVGFRRIGENNK